MHLKTAYYCQFCLSGLEMPDRMVRPGSLDFDLGPMTIKHCPRCGEWRMTKNQLGADEMREAKLQAIIGEKLPGPHNI